ncbi:MAG: MBL fold metallo-hydrolase [Planctomycetaceae bacterium]
MKLVCLGTGGYFPNDRRHTAGYLFPELGILFDAGSSAFRVVDHLQTDELDIFLSHAHLDHIVGLTYLLVPLYDKRIKVARLHARPQDIEAVQQHLFAQPLFPVEVPLEYCEINGEIDLGERGKVSSTPLQHPGGSLGFRINWSDRSFAYITDTQANREYATFIKGADLLLHECYFPDGMENVAEKTGHSCASQVATIAKDAGVKRLGMIHIDPFRTDDDPIGIETARQIFLDTFLTEDNQTIEF